MQFGFTLKPENTIERTLALTRQAEAGVLVPWGIDLPMAVGAVAMSLSTIIVAANAQLLRRVRLRREGLPARPRLATA